MMKTELVEAFLAVLDHGGYQLAAEALGDSASALHKDVRRFELLLGITLFVPVGRQVSPTADAFRIEDSCRNLLAAARAVESLSDELVSGTAGTVRVACASYHIGRFLAMAKHDFVQEHPGIDVEIQVISQDVNFDAFGTLDLVRRGVADFAIGREADATCDELFLWASKVVVAVADDHPFRRRRKLTIHDLEPAPIMVCGPNYGSRRWLELLFRKAGKNLDFALEASPDALLAAAAAGLGFAVYGDDSISPPPRRPFPVLVDDAGRQLEDSVSLRWVRDRVMPVAAQTFLSFVTDRRESINARMWRPGEV